MIKVNNLKVRYHKNQKLIIDDISFTLLNNKINVLIGLNGSGKSTIIQSIVGLNKKMSGSILFDDVDITKLSSKKRAQEVAYVPQNITFGSLSVFETILLGRLPYFNITASNNDIQKVTDIINEMNLNDLINKKVNELSGGEKQKVAICKALVQEPKLLVLDEPTSNLDINSSLQFLKLLKNKIIEKNITVLIAIHDLQLAMDIGDLFFFIKDGKVIEHGDKTILNKENLKECFDIDCKIIDIDNKKVIVYND